MKARFGLSLLLLCWVLSARAAAPEPVTLTAADGVQVFGDWYRADKPKALILLFHQAGSNRGEYAPIAPKLVEAGYSAMAIDQRAGGTLFGRGNETIAKLGRSSDYLDAAKDLDAALDWSQTAAHGLPVLLWGSSYSASLVFLVAAKHPKQVAAVLSFSPGEYLGGSDTVRKAAERLSVPLYVSSSKDAEEVAQARRIFVAAGSGEKTQFVPAVAGAHGSSTLREDRNPRGAAENWKAVLGFLAALH
ncbi:MAG: hypothetical protein NVS9B10_11040 [Nevskia sp.]